MRWFEERSEGRARGGAALSPSLMGGGSRLGTGVPSLMGGKRKARDRGSHRLWEERETGSGRGPHRTGGSSRTGFRIPCGNSETLRLSPHANPQIRTARNADNKGRLSVFRAVLIWGLRPARSYKKRKEQVPFPFFFVGWSLALFSHLFLTWTVAGRIKPCKA